MSAGSLIDSNVLLDIATADAHWMAWSQQQLLDAAARGAVHINPVIYAEIAPAFASQEELDQWLDPQLFHRLPLPYRAGWRAAQAFIQYRKSGGNRTAPLPDFYIGAHAEIERLTLVSRDVGRYRTYFPTVDLITPS
jgi:predicted nucleic acid-binding protein